MAANTQYKEKEFDLWNTYKNTGDKKYKHELIKSFDPIIQSQVNKWSGPISREILESEGRMMASKAIDTYDPNKGTALGTHVTNNLAPMSRIVYTHQNTARLPENVTLKINSYNNAKEYLTSVLGREPTTDELHQELGWSVNELNRMEQYLTKDLIESGGEVNDQFYNNQEDDEEDEDESEDEPEPEPEPKKGKGKGKGKSKKA